MVSKPNDWSKSVAEGKERMEKGELTETKRLQLEFWTAFRQHVLGRQTSIRPQKPAAQHWMNFALGRTGFGLGAVASMWDSVSESYDSNELRAEVGLGGPDSKQRFEALARAKGEIEKELGETPTWYNPPEKRTCSIYLRRSADITDRAKWPEYHEWLLTKLESLHKAFSLRVKQLPSGAAEEDGVDVQA